MMIVTCTVTAEVENRAEAVEFAKELTDHYDDCPEVNISSASSDNLETES